MPFIDFLKLDGIGAAAGAFRDHCRFHLPRPAVAILFGEGEPKRRAKSQFLLDVSPTHSGFAKFDCAIPPEYSLSPAHRFPRLRSPLAGESMPAMTGSRI